MLREIKNVRQIEGESRRRWFTSLEFDLIVWFDEGDQIKGFQLCYDKSGYERALTWRGAGFMHHAVDSGEGPGSGWQKGTPILVADGAFNPDKVVPKLMKESTMLPPELLQPILAQLATWPGTADDGIILPSSGDDEV